MKIFISHKDSRASQADEFVHLLYKLAPHRFDCFVSSQNISHGEHWEAKVERELNSCDWLIALESGGRDKEMGWITKEITIFSKTPGKREKDKRRLCIIVHDPGQRDDQFLELQQFEANKKGCEKFLKLLLSAENGNYGFNPHVGDHSAELDRESDRLLQVLADRPPPRSLLPKGIFRFSARSVNELANGRIDDSVEITMNFKAAEIHGLSPDAKTDIWKGTFSKFFEHLTREQRDWIPLIAFLTRKMFEQNRAQKAFLLYPDHENKNFYTPVANELLEYKSGDKEYELFYVPVETGFPESTGSKKDLLFNLMILCFNTQWRLIYRYKVSVGNFAARERNRVVPMDDGEKEMMRDMWKRILIDFLKIHIEAKARGVENIERIYELFEPEDLDDRKSDFHEWLDVFETIKDKCDSISAVEMEQLLERIERMINRVLTSYSKRLTGILVQ